MRSYDDWKLDDGFIEAPLHSRCSECRERLADVFEQYDGLCADCKLVVATEQEVD